MDVDKIKSNFQETKDIEGQLVTEPVKIESGLVSGVYNADKSVRLFAGIPYAAPPVGNLRWQPPKKPNAWSGVYAADHFSDCAVQNNSSSAKLLYSFLETDALKHSNILENAKISEDCLYLNIWTSAKSKDEQRPVIIYIHGGSFKVGSGSIDIYNGEEMAKKGAVFVTINYRLGILGFIVHPELSKESVHNVSGNYGILDQIASIQWVKNNIAEFGGNPNNITIAGESSGSTSVNILQASPLTKGLFQRAIGESGGLFGDRGSRNGGLIQTLAQAEQAGLKFAQSLKNSSIADLRKMSVDDLLKAAKDFPIRPIIDGYVLPDSIYNIFAEGKQNDIPLLIGSNADESTIFLALPFSTGLLPADKFKEAAEQEFVCKSDEYLKLFPANSNAQAAKSQIESDAMQRFSWHMHTWAQLQSKTGKSKVYYYYFDRVQPGPQKFQELGAYHSSEIAYAYHNLSRVNLPYNSTDWRLSEVMSSYWFNFAANGDPNGTGLPKWPPFNVENEQAMNLGNNIELIPTPHKDKLNFFNSYEAERRAK